MDLSKFIDSCLTHPRMRDLSRRVLNSDKRLDIVNYTDSEKRDAIESEIPFVLAECASIYPFPWLTKTTTFTGGTTSGTADYELSGASQDCSQVLTVLYDDDETFLEFYEQADIDRLRSSVGLTTEVVAWTVKGEQNGFPLITLIGTPDESSIQIKYRYWVDPDKVIVESWPNKWAFLLKRYLIASFFPDLTDVAENAMARAINAHNKGGGKVRRIIQDSAVIQQNIIRNTKYGYGGSLR